MARNLGKPPTDSQQRSEILSLITCKKLNPTNNQSVKVDSSPFKLQMRHQSWPTPWLQPHETPWNRGCTEPCPGSKSTETGRMNVNYFQLPHLWSSVTRWKITNILLISSFLKIINASPIPFQLPIPSTSAFDPTLFSLFQVISPGSELFKSTSPHIPIVPHNLADHFWMLIHCNKG